MIKVKLTTPFPEWPLIRQTPGSKGIWGNCQFFINQEIEECDYWVVYDNILNTEKVARIAEKSILITGEPPTVKSYLPKFINQFDVIITCHDKLNHNNIILTQQGLNWHIGKIDTKEGFLENGKNFDDLRSMTVPSKDRILSIISSNKIITKGHRLRYDFTKFLKNRLKDKIDIYGKGFKYLDDKWEGLSHYKYHIAIENSYIKDYWTEKISDPFLAYSLPIYYGCPNLEEYFEPRSFARIDLQDFKKSLHIVEDLIFSNTFENSIVNIIEARNLILYKYNIFNLIHDVIQELEKNNLKRFNFYLEPQFVIQTKQNFIKKIIHKILL